MKRPHIEICYDVTVSRGVVTYHRATVPVTYRRGTFPIRDVMSPVDLAKLARLANRL